MERAVHVNVTSFGEGRYQVEVPPGTPTVEEALRLPGVETTGRRVAVNGHPAKLSSTVLEGDEITSIPRVRGG